MSAAVIDFQRFIKRAAAADSGYQTPLAPRDMRNLRRLVWHISDHHMAPQAWSQATWRALRKACDTPAPIPFSVGDIPAITAELRRIGQISRTLWDAKRAAEETVLKRLIRGSEAPADVLSAALAQLAEAAKDKDAETATAWEAWDVQRFVERAESGPDHAECSEP